MSVQIAVRIPEKLAERLDALVATGLFASKAEAIRAAIDTMLELERRAAIGRAIVEGYTRTPQTNQETSWADPAAGELLAQLEAEERAAGLEW